MQGWQHYRCGPRLSLFFVFVFLLFFFLQVLLLLSLDTTSYLHLRQLDVASHVGVCNAETGRDGVWFTQRNDQRCIAGGKVKWRINETGIFGPSITVCTK